MTKPPDFIPIIQSLARPVARGVLPFNHAYTTITLNIIKMARAEEVPDLIRIWRHILIFYIDAYHVKSDEVHARICRTLRLLIGIKVPKNRLITEAHRINDDAGKILAEWQVVETVKIQVWHSVQERENRYAR